MKRGHMSPGLTSHVMAMIDDLDNFEAQLFGELLVIQEWRLQLTVITGEDDTGPDATGEVRGTD
jgi:hypothetical protein